MRKKEYEAPVTLYTEVETEQNFCGSVFEPGETEEGVSISGHEIGNSADYSNPDNPNKGWDSDSFNY